MLTLFAGLIILIFASAGQAEAADIRQAGLISGGKFTPLYGVENSDQQIEVSDFFLDTYPVTNKQYADFLKIRTDWQAKNAAGLLSDENYLRHWVKSKDGTYGPKTQDNDKPVVNISWFAANDYCQFKNGRLPSVIEWEYAAAASEEKKNASQDPEFTKKLLDWYSKPGGGTDLLPLVGKGKPNAWGIFDMHGVVWEWTSDFNSVFVSGDNRTDGEKLKEFVCGAGAESATDRANYAAFMRYAMRNSLRGRYTTSNLGFRCAYDSKTDKKD